MASWVEVDRAGVRLACRDFGGSGPVVLLLHGLAGQAGEWKYTASRLAPRYRVLALDQRGHGHSERNPDDVSRLSFAADVAEVIAQLGLAPVALVGQSMGANTALLTAATYPNLVSALIVAEGSPGGVEPRIRSRIVEWLNRWPTAFPSLDAAREFFDSEGLEPAIWIEGLERGPSGLRPRFEKAVMLRCVSALAASDYWDQWRSIRCPILVVRGENGYLTPEHADHLVREAAAAETAETATIRQAGHDVHLENPAEWVSTLDAFLARFASTREVADSSPAVPNPPGPPVSTGVCVNPSRRRTSRR